LLLVADYTALALLLVQGGWDQILEVEVIILLVVRRGHVVVYQGVHSAYGFPTGPIENGVAFAHYGLE